MMEPEQLERALSGEADIAPSSGFASGVMEAVRREALEPPPIPFPWIRALPALAAGVLVLIGMIVAVVMNAGRPAGETPVRAGLLTALARAASAAGDYGIGWIVLAMILTLACIAVSMRLTTGGWRKI